MKSVLKDKYRNYIQQLSEYGYVVIDFLNPSALIRVNQQIQQHSAALEKYYSNGIHMTTWILDNTLKYSIKNELEEILQYTCDTFFEDYRMLNSTYIIKKKHKVSNFPIHQDWSFVDESKYEALNVWIALQDTNINNGGLFVIKGSHKLNNQIRASNDMNSFEAYEKKLHPFLTPVNLKAGQAVLFYYSLLHASAPNLSDKKRLVVSTTILPKDAEIILSYHDKIKNELRQYKMQDDFIYNYSDIRKQGNEEPSNGELVNTIKDYIPAHISYEEIKNTAIINNTSFFDKFLNVFKISF